jgi:hypothetical protein
MSNFQLGPLQTKWLEALESGEYKQQTDNVLRNLSGFCCLGVANEVCELGESDRGYLIHTYSYIGLRDEEGTFELPVEDRSTYIGRRSLTTMNDSGMFTFKEIAKYIRENPENVFVESK